MKQDKNRHTAHMRGTFKIANGMNSENSSFIVHHVANSPHSTVMMMMMMMIIRMNELIEGLALTRSCALFVSSSI